MSMSKGEVLRDVYPEELEMIFERIDRRREEEELLRLDDQINEHFAVILGMTGADAAKNRFEQLVRRREELLNSLQEAERDEKPEQEPDGIEKLRQLQGVIAQQKRGMKRGGG